MAIVSKETSCTITFKECFVDRERRTDSLMAADELGGGGLAPTLPLLLFACGKAQGRSGWR